MTQSKKRLPPPTIIICIIYFHFQCKYVAHFFTKKTFLLNLENYFSISVWFQLLLFINYLRTNYYRMKIIIFGATGLVGMQLVKQALYDGHYVKAYGKNVFTSNLPESKELEVIQGALFDANEVQKAIKGCDAVLTALGGNEDGLDVTRSLGMKNIVAQMQKLKVQRIIGVGGIGILNADENDLIMDTPEFPPENISVSLEHLKAYNFLKESSLSWSFVCPPEIIDAAPTGIFTTKANYPPAKNKFRINSGDLALFMLKEITDKKYLNQMVGISN